MSQCSQDLSEWISGAELNHMIEFSDLPWRILWANLMLRSKIHLDANIMSRPVARDLCNKLVENVELRHYGRI